MRRALALYRARATHGAHVIEQDIELASAVAGDDARTCEPCCRSTPQRKPGATTCSTANATRPVALINPGAGWGAKRWPSSATPLSPRTARRGLPRAGERRPGEEPLAEAIVKRNRRRGHPLNCTLDQLIALTRRIALCIAGDTGPLHLACALGRPVVGIYGPTDPSRNGPFGTRSMCCAAQRAAATTPAAPSPRQAC